jgi:signal transduction histidine kinase
MRATRVFQIAALLIVIVAVVQVGWWVLDQHDYTVEKVGNERVLYEQQVAAARELLKAGVPAQHVRELLPNLAVEAATPLPSGDGTGPKVSVARHVHEALASERDERLNQYAWESVFFLFALGVCITVIWRALRAEAHVVQEQDSFLALVSHQFKTPLASLQLSLETMSIRQLSADQARTLIDRMLADLSRMVAMVSQILDSVRLERGRVTLKREPLELAGAVSRVVAQLEERASHGSARISANLPRGVDVLADPLALDAVVRNLLENAIASVASAGGGTISLGSRRTNGAVELTVTDSGVGFKASERALLFRKFSRLHAGNGGYQGTGLGLFIVSRLMQLSGGNVSAHSPGPGQGASFVLTWPAAPAGKP